MSDLHRTVLIDKNGVRRTYYVRQSPVARGYRYDQKQSAFVKTKGRKVARGGRKQRYRHTIVLYGSDYNEETREREEVEWRISFVGTAEQGHRVEGALKEWFRKSQGHYESKGKGKGGKVKRRFKVPDHKIGSEREETTKRNRSLSVQASGNGKPEGVRAAVRAALGD